MSQVTEFDEFLSAQLYRFKTALRKAADRTQKYGDFTRAAKYALTMGGHTMIGGEFLRGSDGIRARMSRVRKAS